MATEYVDQPLADRRALSERVAKLEGALKEIYAQGTVYPPHYADFTDEQKKKFPPACSWAAKVAYEAYAS